MEREDIVMYFAIVVILIVLFSGCGRIAPKLDLSEVGGEIPWDSIIFVDLDSEADKLVFRPILPTVPAEEDPKEEDERERAESLEK